MKRLRKGLKANNSKGVTLICSMFSKLNLWFFKPVDNSPLVIFRALFGFLLFAEAFGAIITGWVKTVFVTSKMTIPFLGFDWLAQIIHGPTAYFWYAAMAILGLMVMIGYKYKWSVGLYGVLWWSVYLSQKSHYNNHYYLMVVLCFLMLLLPAHRAFSIDSIKSKVRSHITPNWVYIVLIGLFWIVYSYASVNKIYEDWLNAVPISIWFKQKSHYWLIGPLLKQQWMPWLIAYGGIVFDGLIIPALLWRKTRIWAFALNLIFHLFNSAVFQIGVFPYLMIAITVLFFEPETIRSLFLKSKPAIDKLNTKNYKTNSTITIAILAFLLMNILLPLRHNLFEGNVDYTEEGHRMSWRMMLRSKGGNIHFYVRDPITRKKERVELSNYLSNKQRNTLATHPDAVYWFVQKLKSECANKGIDEPIITARCRVRVNKQAYFFQFDQNLNLAEVEWSHFKHNEWVKYPGKK
ncbi:MAG: HTTM domain-containing protein [Bacteroidia bacterium]